MKVYEIIEALENVAPLSYQESYDNSGLAVGSTNGEVSGALCTLDVTMEILDEAIENNCNLIISHHPLIFAPLKSITGKNNVEKIVTKAIKNDISIYSGHTNFDNIRRGVNNKICEKLHLKDCSILAPLAEKLVKLVTFVPTEHAEKVRNALFLAGAGHIGNYDSCSYNLEGYGTFRGDESSNPFVGNQGDLHTEKETRIETIVPRPILRKVVQSMKTFHPYEEVAFDIYPLDNTLE
ncbi:MAG: Nif3-like dinuclear metal center hexameric protein, partial [Bacteroidales bacterium]|nr:Nif3-like dinuclear metal center hexameric protein [Bacteroidales bacterium]